MPALEASYDPTAVEARIAAWWEDHGVGEAEPDVDPPDGEPFVIVIPPPNVTGSLHVGHALDHSIQDVLVRRARMQGRNAVLLPGMDHAGIATQTVVERLLRAEGTSREEIGREAFVDRVWQFREESGGRILAQDRRLGYSADWRREAFTLDEPRSAAVREVFCALYEQGLVYRGLRLINWDPEQGTALSDIEVDHREVDGELTHMRYPSADGGPGVVVATTRPETMLGDTAVAVHPDDERYAALVGTMLRLPLLDREIPVVADEHVDPAFGTGAVKVTPAHDPNDYAIGQRHDLEMIDVMTDEGSINAAGGRFEGLDRFEARRAVVDALRAEGLLEGVEPYRHSVGHSSRSDALIEPRLSEQWFVEVRPLAEAAAAAVRDGRTRFVPERTTKSFLDWLENLHDWCISRQLWWGHRIPAWYDADGNVEVRREDPTPEEVTERGLRRDPDVLDTWFSSQLWPMTLLGWPEDTPELRAWYPTSVLVTGYDINTFWVSRMLMAGLRFTGEVPFRTVLNHGLVRDGHGAKMSKSRGNVVDPMELMDAYGADALRFSLLRGATPGQDIAIAEQWVEGARRFANKLWNAARFVAERLDDQGVTPAAELDATGLEVEDRWLLSRLERARAAADAAYEEFDIGRAAQTLYHFVWDDYCDWYLEVAKLRADDASARLLGSVLDAALRLLHPVMPFVTEAIWQALIARDPAATITAAAWPAPASGHLDEGAEAAFGVLQEVVTALRRFRGEHGLPPATGLVVRAVPDSERSAALEDGREGIRRLAHVDELSVLEEPPGEAGTGGEGAGGAVGHVVVPGVDLFIPLAGLVDLDRERERLARELEKAEAEAERAGRKLTNEGFVAKAPADVVDAERAKVAHWQGVIEALRHQREQLG